jgi:hypothetical protein
MTSKYPLKMAVTATLHCLTGCAIGEVVGLIAGSAWGWSNGLTVAVSVVLAFVFGYTLTAWPLVRMGLSLARVAAVALAVDTVSIAVMEMSDNTVMVLVPGAMNAGLNEWLFWLSMALSLLIGFVLAVPVNAYLLSRGKGHAVMHQYHAQPGTSNGTNTHNHTN